MSFFSKSPAAPLRNESEQQRNARFKRMQWASFFAVTLGVISSALLSNYEGPSITINNDPTPEGAQAF